MLQNTENVIGSGVKMALEKKMTENGIKNGMKNGIRNGSEIGIGNDSRIGKKKKKKKEILQSQWQKNREKM